VNDTTDGRGQIVGDRLPGEGLSRRRHGVLKIKDDRIGAGGGGFVEALRPVAGDE
jgi:hypothetical protein